MKILFVVSELTPIIKVGGLADVAGALPIALRALGHDVRVLLPKYGTIDYSQFPSKRRWSRLTVTRPAGQATINIDEGRIPNSDVPLYYLDWPEMFGLLPNQSWAGVYYEQSGSAGYRKEMERFVSFSWAVPQLLEQIDWQPEVVHCQDWHTAAVPVFLQLRGYRSATVLTIHNLGNQGRWRADEVFSWLGLRGTELPVLSSRDRHGDLNLLQLGIHATDVVNTVSPTYAKEILTTKYGEGLERDLTGRVLAVAGILDGLDTIRFNPATDSSLSPTYNQKTAILGKRKNKEHLQRVLRLPVDPTRPLCISIGRLSSQKGLELVARAGPWLNSQRLQLVVLGTGLPEVEAQLSGFAHRYCAWARLQLGFDAVLAQLLYAAGDFFLMPSRFEPCGLTQMIAMRYGCLPIARATGGLVDTVIDVADNPKRGTGFLFGPFTTAAMISAIARARRVYDQPRVLAPLIARAMRYDFSWDKSAHAYLDLYAQAINHATTI